MCFKCQGLGYIDFECPNQKVIALIEKDEAKEEDVKQVTNLTISKETRRIIHYCQNLRWMLKK